MWSILEALVDGIASGLVSSFDRARPPEALVKLKGPLLSFSQASREQQAELLVSQLTSSLTVPLSPGVAGFEAILDALDLGGSVAALMRRTLVECAAARNVVVLKAGIVDRRFNELCPWAAQLVGSPLALKRRGFERYCSAALWYVLELRRRLCQRDGDLDGLAFTVSTQERILSNLAAEPSLT